MTPKEEKQQRYTREHAQNNNHVMFLDTPISAFDFFDTYEDINYIIKKHGKGNFFISEIDHGVDDNNTKFLIKYFALKNSNKE